MLSYALAISVALSSLVLFSTAFFMSDIHRKDDFLWSGVGLFYALVLWFCARNITGTVLLGQASASILLVSFCWQTLKLRKAIANPERASEINNFSVLQAVNGLLKRNKSQKKATITPPVAQTPVKVTESEISIPDRVSSKAKPSELKSDISPAKQNKSKAFGKFFGKKKKSTITNTKLDEILDDPESIAVTNKEDVKASNSVRVNTADNEESESKVNDKSPEKEPEVVATKEVVNPQLKEIGNSDQQKSVVEEIKSIKTKEPTADNSKPSIAEEIAMPSVENAANISSPVEITKTDINSSENIIQDEPRLDLEKTTTEEIVPEIQASELPETNASSLDSLETVEVAEVLEAVSENISSEKQSYRSEIIEVDPTEIDNNSDPETK